MGRGLQTDTARFVRSIRLAAAMPGLANSQKRTTTPELTLE